MAAVMVKRKYRIHANRSDPSPSKGFVKSAASWLGSHGLEPTPRLYIELVKS